MVNPHAPTSTSLGGSPSAPLSDDRGWLTHHSSGSEDSPSDWAELGEPNGSPSSVASVSGADKVAALVELGQALLARGYEWVCPSAETQALVNGRFANRYARSLPDLFGWNRMAPVQTVERLLPTCLVRELEQVGVLQVIDGEILRSRVRFSSFAGVLMAQPAWPSGPDLLAVGPELFRFGGFLQKQLNVLRDSSEHTCSLGSVIELNGGGAAAILAIRTLPFSAAGGAPKVMFRNADLQALRYAEVNSRIAGIPTFECVQSDGGLCETESPTLVLANPLVQSLCESGTPVEDAEFGTGPPLKLLEDCMKVVGPGSAIAMTALAPVVRGTDIFRERLDLRLADIRRDRGWSLNYDVLEIDIFGSRLNHPAYAEADRLMQVGIMVQC